MKGSQLKTFFYIMPQNPIGTTLMQSKKNIRKRVYKLAIVEGNIIFRA